MDINVAGWFEIPVSDMERAIRFYETVFGFKLERNDLGDLVMAWFPANYRAEGAAGSLVYKPGFYKPSQDGTLVYFTSPTGNLQNELNNVQKAGGEVLIQKRLVTEDIGYMGLFVDSEGNRVALHSLR